VTDIDFDAFGDAPLRDDAIRCLRYMHDVEHHTVCYLRDLLVTPAHRDPVITDFLTLWSYEEVGHGRAIGRVLAAHGEPSGSERIGAMRRRAQRLCRATLRRLWRSVGAGVMPRREVTFVVGALFGGERGRAAAARIDRRIDALPGQAGLRLVERAVADYTASSRSQPADRRDADAE
jgi:hypothetical protein